MKQYYLSPLTTNNMKNMNNMLKLSSLLTMAVMTTSTSQAALVFWTGGGDGSSWSDGANWGGSVPGSADAGYVNTTQTINSSGTTTTSFNLETGTGTQLNLTGGAYTIAGATNTTSGYIKDNVLNISGGNHDFQPRMQMSAGGTLQVTGSAATINLGQTTGAMEGTYKFVFDAAGVSSLDHSSYVQFAASAKLVVDGSLYTGGSGDFVLIDTYSNGLLSTFSSPTVTGFSSGYNVQLVQDNGDTDDRIYLSITAVPEPSSTALLGLGGLALMLRRKRS
jgi:hypothetical protein